MGTADKSVKTGFYISLSGAKQRGPRGTLVDIYLTFRLISQSICRAIAFVRTQYLCGFQRDKLPRFATRHISHKNKDIRKSVLIASKSLLISKSNFKVGNSSQSPDTSLNHFTLCVGGFVGFCFKLSWRFHDVTFFKKRLYRMHKQWPN